MSSTTWYATLYDAAANHAKFYKLDLNEQNGVVTATYGRVGATNPQTATYIGGRYAFERKRAEKERKGYREISLAGENGASAAPVAVAKAARKSLVAGESATPALTALVERIAAANKHAITTATGGRITFDTRGKATLPGGIVVTAAHVDRARAVLGDLEKKAARQPGPAHTLIVERYFMLIPHAVGAGRGWADRVLTSREDLERESDLLDALAATTAAAPDADEDLEIAFRYTVSEASAEETARVKAEYVAASFAQHPVARLQVARVFALADGADHAAAFDATASEIGNVKPRWHGTATHNLLNILRTGLVVPAARTGTFDYHGALLGPGIYSSSMSTKAAGYGYGTWGGVRDDSCYVFLADVACGWEYRMDATSRLTWQPSRQPDPTTRSKSTGEPRRFHSIEVYAGGTRGARNPETVVWDATQVRLRYLVQLGMK